MPKDACCPEQRLCEDGSCIAREECCPEAPAPLCDPCEDVVCSNGVLVCQGTEGDDECVQCPEGSVVCPLALEWLTGMPSGCCRADRIFPDVWYGTGNQYCRTLLGPESYWCTTDGF